MPVASAKKKKRTTRQTRAVESRLKKAFPKAKVDVYRYNPASIRVRVIDSAFREISLVEREARVLPHIHALPSETQADITILLLLAPGETSKSLMNFEFDDPEPSAL